MKDTSRQPTSVARLEKLTEDCLTPDVKQLEEIQQWLQWTHNFLSARKLYHKKTAVKSAILQKMAKTLLSADELAAIDAEAEKQLVSLDQPKPIEIRAIVGVCKEDDPDDVDEAYGEGTYARLFPSKEDE